MRTFIAHTHAFILGFQDGWAQPTGLSSSSNVDHLETGKGDVHRMLDKGINLGQLFHAGTSSQTWEEGYWPVKR